ncbi:hypothetical protein [Neisseria zoodegmatis]|uniref:Integral membrane protein n=1 Tax=Neisseria zoodegmatis TaxID=326523 RepID=A0A1X3CT93_9NEIS|nr:hypothetical protein [Neisseria zoodegmatis]OSI10840.1 hypothetical protein BWD10_02700 [Neisseria zoodegmatis]SNU80071.1 Uncharacterised protein [Neisseria zoodegmatis]SUA35884.1 Uncharacterised protein [Neisseria zoodegmatis]
MNGLIILNVVLALASAAFGLFALFAPQRLSGSPELSMYYPHMYAARAVPFGLGLAAVLVWLPGQATAWLLVAGVIQAIDSLVNIKRGVVAVISPALVALVHIVSAYFL